MASSPPKLSAAEKGKGKADVSDDTCKQEDIIRESDVAINEIRDSSSGASDSPNSSSGASDSPDSSSGASDSPDSSSGASDSPDCIFKIPEFLNHNRHNSYGYEPTLVSIGPYHQEKPQLELLKIKGEFKELFIRMAGDGLTEKKLLEAVEEKGEEIKRSYSNPFRIVNHKNLLTTMVLDGCFILTLFLEDAGEFLPKNAIFNMPWVMSSIRRDLLLFENQIPLLVLQILLRKGNFPRVGDLNKLAFDFFRASFKSQNNSGVPLNPKHLLDLIRQAFILNQPPPRNATTSPQTNSARLTLPASKLLNCGVEFEVKKNAASFLDISFDNGVLQIPEIILDDFLSVVLLNCIAFEQFYASGSTHISSYTIFMACLVNSDMDVAYFVDKGIIHNYLGTQDELSGFFKRVLNDYVFEIEGSYLEATINDVGTYCSNHWKVKLEAFDKAYLRPYYSSSVVLALIKLAPWFGWFYFVVQALVYFILSIIHPYLMSNQSLPTFFSFLSL